MDLAEFLTRDNLIFFSIGLAVLAVFIAILIFVIRAILRMIKALIKKLFKKEERGHAMEGALTDKGEDLTLEVEELEKSKKETSTKAKQPPLEYIQPIKGKEEQLQTEKKDNFAEKEKQEIEAGLDKLKHSGQAQEKKSFLERHTDFFGDEDFMPKIKIPVSRHYDAKAEPVEPESKPEAQTIVDKNGVEKKLGLEHAKVQEQPKTAEPEPKEPENKKIEKVVEQGQEPEKLQEKESPVSRAKSYKHPETAAGKIVSPTILTKTAGVGLKPKLEDKETDLYEKPEFEKDELGVGKIRKNKEQEIEAGLDKLKHSGQAQEKKSFLGEQIKGRQESRLGEIPIPRKVEAPAEEKESEVRAGVFEKLQKQEPPAISAKEKTALKGVSSVSRAIGRRESEKQQGSQLNLDPLREKQYIKQVAALQSRAEEQEKKEEIPLYEKPDFMRDDLGAAERREKRRQAEEEGLSPIERAEAQRESKSLPGIKAVDGQGSRYMRSKDANAIAEQAEENKGLASLKKSAGASAEKNDTIFGGKEELTRIQLKNKLRYDPKVWKAGIKSRFYLSREQRASLEKELFPKIYGRNISKQDFNRRVRNMIKERGGLIAGGNAGKAENLRKEINFLKKISGVKGSWQK